MRLSATLALALLALPSVSRSAESGTVAYELAANGGQNDPDNPRSGAVTNTVSGGAEVVEGLNLDLAFGVTYSFPTPAVAGRGGDFGSRGGFIFNVAPSFDWQIDHHFALGLGGSFAPQSSLVADSKIQLEGVLGNTTDYDAALRSTTASQGLSMTASFDTAGESDAETALTLSAGLTHFSTQQHIEEIRGPGGGEFSAATLLGYCISHPLIPVCRQKQLLAALRTDNNQPFVDLFQYVLTGAAIETLYRDTDLGATFSYYLYDRDPTTVGYYSMTTVGRTASFGDGLPLAPLLWSLRPEAAHRFGPFSLKLYYTYQQYVGDEGHGNVLGLKAQLKVTRSWKVSLTASGMRDVDAQGNQANSGTVALGVRWTY
jgi:hypothetical protein